MSDYGIYLTAYLDILRRYKSAKEAISILRKENGKLKKIPSDVNRQREEIDRLNKKVEAQRAEINNLLSQITCKKVRLRTVQEAQLFAKFLEDRTTHRFTTYPCPDSGEERHYHVTHRNKSMRGLFG